MADDTPDISSKAELTSLCEVEDYETGQHVRSTFAFVDPTGSTWFGQVVGVRKYDLSVADVKRHLKRIPDHVVYPLAPKGVAVLQHDDPMAKSHFIKRPKLLCLDNEEEARLLPRMLLQEVEILERLKRDHHPNLVLYHGCVLKEGRIIGIALKHYRIILQYRFEDDPRPLNVAACLRDIRAGIDHLHALGLAHNDINPTNIAFDAEDHPVILDFGSCRKFGESLVTGGTPGWIDEDYGTSDRQHDQVALQKLELWLVDQQRRRNWS